MTTAVPTITDPLSQQALPDDVTALFESGRNLARLTLDQYHGLVAAGVLDASSRMELLDGLLVEKMPKSPLHTAIATRFLQILYGLKLPNTFIGSERPITLTSENSEPESDIAIIRGSNDDFLTDHPTAADVLLLIEIANTSLRKDQRNVPRFAAAGVPRLVVVDVVAETMTLHEQPTAEGYGRVESVDAFDILMDGRSLGTIHAADVFPPAK